MSSKFTSHTFAVTLVLLFACSKESTGPINPDPQSLSAPALSLPSNGATRQSTSPELVWLSVSSAIVYQIQVSETEAFATVPAEDSMLITCSKRFSGLKIHTVYYWRARAKNAGGASEWSGAWSFTTDSVSGEAIWEWTLAHESKSRTIYSVCWGEGLFLAVGNSHDSSLILSSSNGTDWADRTFTGSNRFVSVTWGCNQFVALGDSGVFSSPDGIAWTRRHYKLFEVYSDVIWGNNEFIATSSRSGDSGYAVIFISKDGISWTTHNTGAKGGIVNVAWGNNMYVAVGGTVANYHHSGIILISYNGIAWEEQTIGIPFQAVAWGNKKFVAIAGYYGVTSDKLPIVCTSSDGRIWSISTNGISLKVLNFFANSFIATSDCKVLTSTDGNLWTMRKSAPADIYDLTWGNGKLVAVGMSRNDTGNYGAICTTELPGRQPRSGELLTMPRGCPNREMDSNDVRSTIYEYNTAGTFFKMTKAGSTDIQFVYDKLGIAASIARKKVAVITETVR